MCNLNIRMYPDHTKLCIFLRQFMTKAIQIIIIPDLIGKGCIYKHRIIILQSIKSQIQYRIILVITDLFLEEIGRTIVFLVCDLKDLLGKHDQCILIQINTVGECLCEFL